MCVSMTCAAAAVCLSGVSMVRKMVKCAEREKVGNSDEEHCVCLGCYDVRTQCKV